MGCNLLKIRGDREVIFRLYVHEERKVHTLWTKRIATHSVYAKYKEWKGI